MIIDRYLELGLRLGRHIDGFVDAYYGPQQISERVAAEAVCSPQLLAADAARLIADLDAGVDEDVIDARRRRWIRAQVLGLHTSARKLAGEDIAYADEVEWCYGVRPTFRDEQLFADAHRRLDAVLPSTAGHVLHVVDFKTGKPYSSHTQQGDLYALMTQAQYGQAQRVFVHFWYLDTPALVQTTAYPARHSRAAWEKALGMLEAEQVWAPHPGVHCRWCPYHRDKGGPCGG